MDEFLRKDIPITPEEKLLAGRFARETCLAHINFNRSRTATDKFENILAGKLGEIVFQKAMGESNFSQKICLESKENSGPDSGYDAIGLDGSRYDVKTLDGSWKNKVYINHPEWSINRCDYFVAVRLDMDAMTGQVIGFCKSSDAAKALQLDERFNTKYLRLENFVGR